MSERRVVLVTGASRGIGRGLAERFARLGHVVIGCSRSPATTPDVEHMVVDVTDERAVKAWIADVQRRHGRLDVVVNNAGVGLAAFAAMTPTARAEEVMRTNFLATFLVCREAVKVMMRQKSGRIVNLSSVALPLRMEGASVYAASKSAVVAFSQTLAKEVAPLQVTCNVVAPSLVETEMYAALAPAVRDRYLELLTVKRPVTLDEVFHAVAFFADEASACTTGQVLTLGLAA